MMDFSKSLIEKISSYNLFNNLLPGAIFSYIVERTSRIVISSDSIWKNLFIYYFIGLLVGRISSLLIEPLLMKLTIKKNKNREPYIKFAPYEDYIKASEENDFIKILNESSNLYRCLVATFLLIVFCKLYDWFLYDFVKNMGNTWQNLLIIVLCLLSSLIFVLSYRKQVDYIRKRVEVIGNHTKANIGGGK